MLKNLTRTRGMVSLMHFFNQGIVGLVFLSGTPVFALDDWCYWDRLEKPCGGAAGYCYKNPDETEGGFVAYSARVDYEPGLLTQLLGLKPTISRNAEVCGTAEVLGDSAILGYSSVAGRAKVIKSKVTGGLRISGEVQVLNGATVSGSGSLSQNEIIDGKSLVVNESRALPLVDDLAASRTHAQAILEKEWYGLRIDRGSELELKSAYHVIKRQLPFIQRFLPKDESGYQVNLNQMMLDPYRHLHNSDLNAIYSGEVKREQMLSIKELWLVSYHMIPPEFLKNVGYEEGHTAIEQRSKDIDHLFWNARGYELFMTYAMKQQTHKRFLRLHDHFQKMQDENLLIGELLPVSYLFLRLLPLARDRVCTDEIQRYLTILEKEFLNDSIESVVHAGDFFSRVFNEEKRNYLQSHIRLVKADKHHIFEHRSEMLHRLNLLLHFPFSLTGAPSGVSYLSWGAAGHISVRPVQVFARFFIAESVSMLTENDLQSGMPDESLPQRRVNASLEASPEPPKVDFVPLTISRMINLLDEARQKGLATANGSGLQQPELTGFKITNHLLTEFCLHDNEVSQSSERVPGPSAFSELSDLMEALYDLQTERSRSEQVNPTKLIELQDRINNNLYFFPAKESENEGNIVPKRKFWIHMLAKYGYIIPESIDTVL